MPKKISFIIPCESQWIEGIYQLECSDRLTGYDPETGIDGISNQQGKELGDRTLYLRDLLSAEHVNGHHSFKSEDFTNTTQIPESALDLDHSTASLHDKIVELNDGINQNNDNLNNLTDINLSYITALKVLMPYSMEYFDNHTGYEIFSDYINLRSFGYTKITREILGDDSLDVESSEGLEPGKTYFLMNTDGTDIEEVVVLSVLENNRVRLTSDLIHTRSSGYMASTTLLPQQGKAEVKPSGFVYLSDYINVLEGSEAGQLCIHRDNVDVSKTVYYLTENGNSWQIAEYVRKENFYDGTIDDIYTLPVTKLKLRIEYSGNAENYNLYYFVVRGINNHLAVEEIRRPEISNVSVSGSVLQVHGNTYASLWGVQQAGAEARVVSVTDNSGLTVSGTVEGEVSDVTVRLPEDWRNVRPLYVQLRYKDTEGTLSRWSTTFVVE